MVYKRGDSLMPKPLKKASALHTYGTFTSGTKPVERPLSLTTIVGKLSTLRVEMSENLKMNPPKLDEYIANLNKYYELSHQGLEHINAATKPEIEKSIRLCCARSEILRSRIPMLLLEEKRHAKTRPHQETERIDRERKSPQIKGTRHL